MCRGPVTAGQEPSGNQIPVRLLVTVSRTWWNFRLMREVLTELYEPGAVLVSGHCPRGDQQAEQIWMSMGGTVEIFPANWETYGRRAGYVRNAEMVRTYPDLCVAFIHGGSPGASMTAELAAKYGIHTIIHRT